jgi:hypothetical protein
MPRVSQGLRPRIDQGSVGTPPFKKPRLQTCRQSPGIVTKVCMPARGRVCTIELMCAAARRLMPSHRASRLWKHLIDRLPAQLTQLPQEPPARSTPANASRLPANTSRNADDPKAVKKSVFWQGDGTEASLLPVFSTEAPLLPVKKLQEVCGGLLYRADRVTDRVAEPGRMQEDLECWRK